MLRLNKKIPKILTIKSYKNSRSVVYYENSSFQVLFNKNSLVMTVLIDTNGTERFLQFDIYICVCMYLCAYVLCTYIF